jgi:hypothetical protein
MWPSPGFCNSKIFTDHGPIVGQQYFINTAINVVGRKDALAVGSLSKCSSKCPTGLTTFGWAVLLRVFGPSTWLRGVIASQNLL